jgi:hypothetical protein
MPKTPGKAQEEPVPGIMPHGVVYLLEMIQVE